MLRRLLPLLLAAFLTTSLAGCDLFGDEDGPRERTQGVFVANQGNFSDNNGTISVYDPVQDEASPQALTNFNSIIQGITIFGRRLYVSANTGGRIDVFDTDSLGQVAQVSGLDAPRYVELTQRGIAAVTVQSFADSSSIRFVNFDVATPSITDTVTVPGTPEGITLTSERIYAALGAFGDTTLVGAIERRTQAFSTVDVGCATRFVLADNGEDIYAVCSDKAEVVRLEGSTGDILGRIALPDTASTLGPGQTASFSERADELYVVVGDRSVVRIDTESEMITAEIGPVEGERGIGAVAYDATREELYLGRLAPPPAGFTTQGRVSIHNRSGAQTGSFAAGVAPTHIAFRRITR